MPKERNSQAETSTSTPRTEQNQVASCFTAHSSKVLRRALVEPSSLIPTDLLSLQRTIGNRNIGKLLSPLLQPKLRFEAGGGQQGQETNRLSTQQVVQQMNPPQPARWRDKELAQMNPFPAHTISNAQSSPRQVVKRTFQLLKDQKETRRTNPINNAVQTLSPPPAPLSKRKGFSLPSVSGNSDVPSIQRLQTPAQPPAQKQITVKDSGKFKDFGNTNSSPYPNTGASKLRAGEVEALIPSTAYGTGTKPSVDPLGWDYAAQVAVQKPNKNPKPHRGWVRFHLLNEKLGGPGNNESNLVPTLNVYNSCQAWQTNFEETAKAYLDPSKAATPALNPTNQSNPITFEVKVDYHANVASNPAQPGDNQLEKFPKKIEAEFKYFDSNSGQWKSPQRHGTVSLQIPAPSVTPGNVEFVLTDCSTKTLTETFGVDRWLAARVQDNLEYIKGRKSIQHLYDTLSDNMAFALFTNTTTGSAQGDLDKHWPALENALNKTTGTSLRLYPGWSPTGAKAIRKVAKTFSLERLIKAAQNPNSTEAQEAQHNLQIDSTALSYFTHLKDPTTVMNASDLYREIVPYHDYRGFDQKIWPQIHKRIGQNAQIYFIDLKLTPIETKTEYFQKATQTWDEIQKVQKELSISLKSEKAREIFEQHAQPIVAESMKELSGGFQQLKKPADIETATKEKLKNVNESLAKKDNIEQTIHEKIAELGTKQGLLTGTAPVHFGKQIEQLIHRLYSPEEWKIYSAKYTQDVEREYSEYCTKSLVENWLQQEVQKRGNVQNPTNEQNAAIAEFNKSSAGLHQKVYEHKNLKSETDVAKYCEFYKEQLDAYEAKASVQAVKERIKQELQSQIQQLMSSPSSEDSHVANGLEKNMVKLLKHIDTHVRFFIDIPQSVKHYLQEIEVLKKICLQDAQKRKHSAPSSNGEYSQPNKKQEH